MKGKGTLSLMFLLLFLFCIKVLGLGYFALDVSLKFPEMVDYNLPFISFESLEEGFSYVYQIKLVDGSYSQIFTTKSPVLNVNLENQGTYKIGAVLTFKNNVLFFGGSEVTVNYDIPTKKVEITMTPNLVKILLTLDVDDVSAPTGKKVKITYEYPDFTIVIPLNINTFPVQMELFPGTYRFSIIEEKDVNSNSILFSTDIGFQSGSFYSLMISFKNKKISLLSNLAKMSKIVAFDATTREVIFEKEGKYKLSNTLLINGKSNVQWSSLLYPGISELFVTFSSGEITDINYVETLPSTVRVLLSSKLSSTGSLVSSSFDYITVKVSQPYFLFVLDNTYQQVANLQSGELIRFQRHFNVLIVETNNGIIGPFGIKSRFYLKPLSSNSSVEIVEKGKKKYFGSFEIVANNDGGLSIINELPIEEYLKTVVSSEMPSTYHPEALKAQAVVARTYTLNKILADRRYARLGANIDDSTNFQAYNFSSTNEKATNAVIETSGEILGYQGKPAATFYYAVSGGYALSPEDVFRMKISYITPKMVAVESELAVFLDDEQAITNFLKNSNVFMLKSLGFPEAVNGYFRWRVEYTPEEILQRLSSLKNLSVLDSSNSEDLKQKFKFIEVLADFINLVLTPNLLEERNATVISELVNDSFKDSSMMITTDPSMIPTTEENFNMTEQKSGTYQRDYFDFSDNQHEVIVNIYITQRTTGKYVKELVVETNKRLYKIADEQVLKLFSPTGKKVVLRNGIVRSDFTSLPSSFFAVDVVKNDYGYAEKVILYGGGFGHGIGMSQVAANFLAKDYGWDYTTILTFFYPGTVLSKVY